MFVPFTQHLLVKPRWVSSVKLAKQKTKRKGAFGHIQYRHQYHLEAWPPRPQGLLTKAAGHILSLGDQKHQHSSASKLDLKAQLSQSGRLTVVTGKSKLRLVQSIVVMTDLCKGGSRGIGFHIGECIASLGGDIALLDLMEPQEDLKLIESIYGTRVRFYKYLYRTQYYPDCRWLISSRTDVSSQAEIEKSFDQVVSQQGNISNWYD